MFPFCSHCILAVPYSGVPILLPLEVLSRLLFRFAHAFLLPQSCAARRVLQQLSAPKRHVLDPASHFELLVSFQQSRTPIGLLYDKETQEMDSQFTETANMLL